MSSVGENHRGGFGLIELLVAMAVLGILLSAIIGLTTGFLGFSRRINVINERLVDINDAMGYVGLNVRRAMRVAGDEEVTSVTVTGIGDAFDCHLTSTDGACLGLLVPVRHATETWRVDRYDLLAYRVVPISAWTVDNPGLAEGWAADRTPLMLEYRARLSCGAPDPVTSNPCPPPPIPSSVAAQQLSLVIADLAFETAAGVAFEPFTVAAETSRVTVRMRSIGSGQNADITVPGDEPLETVFVRRP